MPAHVIAIFGPTTSGKTATAVELALRIDGEIVSADSMQIYHGLACLTNQPSVEERQGVPHHLIGYLEPWASYDVVQFAADAHAAIDDILGRGYSPIVVGGSGLYLRAALADLAFPPRPEQPLRERIRAEVNRLDATQAHAWLSREDPAAAARIEPADRRRVARALELVAIGESLAPSGADALWTDDTRHPTRIFGLQVPREELHRRIDARTPVLLEQGGIDEVAALHADSRELSPTLARAHGVDDVGSLLRGEINRAECARRLAARTRQYAKRQDTWLRRLPTVELIDADQPPIDVAKAIAARLLP